MSNQGGKNLTPDQLRDQQIRADMCEIATGCCYEHGARVVDALLNRFHVTRKSLKEKAS